MLKKHKGKWWLKWNLWWNWSQILTGPLWNGVLTHFLSLCIWRCWKNAGWMQNGVPFFITFSQIQQSKWCMNGYNSNGTEIACLLSDILPDVRVKVGTVMDRLNPKSTHIWTQLMDLGNYLNYPQVSMGKSDIFKPPWDILSVCSLNR